MTLVFLESFAISSILLYNIYQFGDVMEISKEEYMKIFDYILENYNDLIDGYYFSNAFLIEIRNYVKDKRLDDEFMLNIHEQLLIKHFLDKQSSFNEDTPSIFISNDKCIDSAIKNDIYSIDYIYNIQYKSEEYQNLIIDKVLNSNYILSKNSPYFIKNNYNIAYKSISKDYTSCDYVDYFHIKEENNKKLKQIILDSNYTLNKNSPDYLKDDLDITIHSIKIDVNSFKYSNIELEKNIDIIYLLIENNYQFSFEELKRVPVKYLKDSIILSKCFKTTNLFNLESDDYIELYSEIYSECIKSYPTIKDYDSIYDYLNEKKWNEYRLQEKEYLTNVHNKILSMLKNNIKYKDFIYEFSELGNRMSFQLQDKYNVLMDAIKEYHRIIHSNKNNNRLNEVRNTIVGLSALYIAKSKENFKSERIRKLDDLIKTYYRLRIDNEEIQKKVTWLAKKEKFIKLYENNDKNIIEYVKQIKHKYINLYGRWLARPIKNFFELEYTELYDTISKPLYYEEYLKYLEAHRLVNRLNNKYIKYEDQELNNYKDIIIFNQELNRYVVTIQIEDEDIEKCREYKDKEIIYKKFLKEIMMYINNIKVDLKYYKNYIYELKNLFPFKDEFFEFDDTYLSSHSFNLLLSRCVSMKKFIKPKIIFDKRYSNIIIDILVKNNLIWLWLLDNNSYYIDDLLRNYSINIDKLTDIFNKLDKIVEINKYLNLDITNIEYLITLNNLVKCSNTYEIFLLGPVIINKLVTNRSYTSTYNKEYVIQVACELLLKSPQKYKSSIPYINGKYNEYTYETYDSLDDSILTSGIDTDSCLTPCGNDNDFLHYIMLNENGFAIKITDSDGKFIGRAAGIRNGNIIFINQLRTIYDIGGSGYRGKHKSEQKEIIDTLINACNKIIETSYNNKEEITKIDYVFATQSYSLQNYPVDVELSNQVKKALGNYPVDIKTNNWYNFITYNNLQKADIDHCFTTDYSIYNLVCLAKSKEVDSKTNLNPCEVDSIYKRKRNKIQVITKIDFETIRRVNKIKFTYDYYHYKKDFNTINIEENSIVIIGDNWYIIYNNGNIIDCVIDYDSFARKEHKQIKSLLLEYKNESINKIYKLIKS